MAAEAVFAAIGEGDVATLTQLIKDNADFSVDCIDASNDDKNTPLHAAAEGEAECMKVLLKAKGAAEALKMKNEGGDEPMTPLMVAIKYEEEDLVSLMLEPAKFELENAAAAEKTEEAVEFARKLDGAPAVLALFGIEKKEEEKKLPNPEDGGVGRRASVSGTDINSFSSTYADESKSLNAKRAGRTSHEASEPIVVSEDTLKAIRALPEAAQAEIFAKLAASGWKPVES